MPIWLVLEMGSGSFWKQEQVRVICHGGKVWVPETMVPEIMTMYHEDRGHFGVKRTV